MQVMVATGGGYKLVACFKVNPLVHSCEATTLATRYKDYEKTTTSADGKLGFGAHGGSARDGTQSRKEDHTDSQ